MRMRLATASELLARGLSVSTVAFECGFADQSHLSRNFKAVYGLTPAAGEAVGNGPAQTRRAWWIHCARRRDLHLARVIS
jgi:transcriptional regulator GlxA family with amidase domain